MALSSKDSSKDRTAMAKETNGSQTPRDGVISIIGPGMRVDGDCSTEGTLRIEGHIKGTVRAGKAVVISKDGVVEGDVITQDAIIGGKVTGSVAADSRLELQATCEIQGEIRARRIKLDEGGQINGNVRTGDLERASGAGRSHGTDSSRLASAADVTASAERS
jgi:cytoskeletal protein CcmA (bactofilin family)